MTKILIIDDEEGLVDAMEDMFSPRGFTVLRALRGSKGIELAYKEKPALVILDLRMPGIGGESVLQTIKQQLPSTKVLVYTAWTGDETRQRILQKGADAFLEKPGDFEALERAALQLLKQ